ncbi:MAG TPA: integrase [Curvibacter sp.]|nr:integrase [Curvibacter sp.]
MGRKRERESAAGLLPRMEAIPGKRATLYRYHPVGGKPINLGHDRLQACRKVLDILGQAPETGRLRWVWESYKESRRFLRLAEATRADYEQCWKAIDPVLGNMQISDITAPIVARYVRIERSDAPVRANREKALLSNLFAHGIDLGVCTQNPAKHVRPNEEEARTEAPDPALLAKFLTWVSQQTPQRQIIGMAAEYASLAGNRKVEFLPLTWPQVDRKAGEIRTIRAKQRGKKREQIVEVVSISPAMEKLLERLETIRPGRECLYVFPTRDGNAYTDRGFKTLWQRIMLAAIEAKVVTKDARFTFHDLRAYYATQHKVIKGKLPDLHNNVETTARVYDRSKVVRRDAV